MAPNLESLRSPLCYDQGLDHTNLYPWGKLNVASVQGRIYPMWSWWLGKPSVGHFPGYLGVKDALWGPFNPEYNKPLQLTGKLEAILGNQIFISLLMKFEVCQSSLKHNSKESQAF